MKKYNILWLSLFFPAFIYSQYTWGSSQSTNPVGVTNLEISPQSGGDTSYTFLSGAYNQDSAYSGSIESINGVTLTFIDLDGSLEETPYGEDELVAYLLKIRDGNPLYNGMVFPVIANNGNSVTIGEPPENIALYFSENDCIDIIEANTLKGLFGEGEDFHGLKGTPSKSDNILIWTSVGWKTYFYKDEKWQTFGTRADQGSTIIYPDEGIIYARRGEEDLTLSFSGNAPVTVQSYMPGPNQKFLMANPFPIEASLSQLINTESNWEKSNNVNEADQILAWSGSTWNTYYLNTNNQWINAVTQQEEDLMIKSGESFFIARSDGFGSTALNAGFKKIDIPLP